MGFTVGLDTSALDVKFKSHALRGIGRYVYELKSYFDQYPGNGVRVATFDHREFKDKGFVNRLIEFLPAGRQTIRQQVVYPFRLGRHKKEFDVFHFPAHMDAPAWSIRNYVLTVLDLIPLVLSDLYKADRPTWRFAFARWLEIRAIKNASLVLAISDNTARDVHRLLGIPEERIVVTPLGVNDQFFRAVEQEKKESLRAKCGLPPDREIVLYVGGIDPRKNYVGLIESFSQLLDRCRAQGRDLPCLVMAGEIKSDREYPKLLALIAEKDLSDSIFQTGYVSEEDLPVLYALSAVLFFPSLYEGFGLTPLESMATGTPVVSSNASCMPEVLGDAALLVEPKDYEAAGRSLFDVLNTPSLRMDLSERGKRRARLFPWSRTGELTLQAYEKILTNNYGAIAATG